MRGKWLGPGLVAVVVLALTGCAPGPNVERGVDATGQHNFGFVLGACISLGGSGAGSRGKGR